ncbi:PAS domain-containing sensor histidine kinase [Natrinema saccharevitans]|uniref:histidine kinase n=1 Tax=Natrinema saccharevitans TaxID=301967 RepID=A0A1S8AUG3_9EURY|nr:PAS domain-containing sensor histidine kinase [Natrinema saccharevitans]OLZ40227.1 PAS domain-containing sensor histidine kinase [Natrinema saccharevitans]
MADSKGDDERPADLHQKLVEQSGDIATIIDPDGTITYVSPSVKRILGYEPEDLIGDRGYEYVHPDDRAANARAVERAQDRPDSSHVVEVRFRRADGTWCWIESTLRARLDDPVIGGILATSRDITERKTQAQSYRKLADEYETLLDNVEDAIFLLDVRSTEDGKSFVFERLSPSYEEQTGFTTQHVRGKTPREVFGAERGAELEANYRRCLRAREPISYGEELPVAEDAHFWDTVLAPVIIDGEITRIVGITRNVTERVRRERQLERQNDRLQEFASVVSHDLRNPLNVAQGRMDLLSDAVESEHLEPTKQALERMEEIIQDTLTLAKQGQVVSDMEAIDLGALSSSCWQTVATDDATLVIGDQLTIRGDRSRLRHLFENLFRNAVEHGGTAVSVRVGRFGDHGIYVEDDGRGIPVESRDAVLEPGQTSAADGTGFGLTIVNRIAEAHGWTLRIRDSADGGARFEFQDVDIVEQWG